MKTEFLWVWLSCLAATAILAGASGCGGSPTVRIDGSSTVFPVTEGVAVEFRESRPDVRVSVGFSGTGAGFEKFIAGEIDICEASRKIKDVEREQLDTAGVDFVELLVAYDGLAVVVHPENGWVDCLTVEQLKRLWEPESAVQIWSDLNDEWPKERISLFGPGHDSGTFDYFTEYVVGESRKSRSDYQKSEDDNVLVSGIAEGKYSLGYFGYAYYAENRDRLKLVAVDSGDGCVKPSEETVLSGEYRPLSRPLFVYVRKSALQRPDVVAFVEYYVDNVAQVAKEVGYVGVPTDQQDDNRAALAAAIAP